MNKLTILLFLSEIAWAKNLNPSEPGTVRGCAWSPAWGPGPTPDLVGDWVENIRRQRNDFTVVVAGSKASPYLTRNRVIAQNPPECSRWQSQSREVQVTLSAGKNRIEAAFVKNAEGKFVPYSASSFGPPVANAKACVTSKGGWPIYDIGAPVVESLYHETACSLSGIRTLGPQQLTIAMMVDSSEARSRGLAFKAQFKARNQPVHLSFSDYFTLHFMPVNPGFHASGSISMIGSASSPRVTRVVTASQPFEVKGRITVDKDVPAGEHWLTFAFRSIDQDEWSEVTEPVKISLPP